MSAPFTFALACVVLAAAVNGQFPEPVPKGSKCPVGDASHAVCHEFRETWCLFGRGDCNDCSECTSCGMYNSAACTKNLAFSNGPCLSNYVVLPVKSGEPGPPRCGCAPGLARLGGKGACVPVVVPAPPPADFQVAPYAKCPGGCSVRASYCTQKTTCTNCNMCKACGNFGSQPCPYILLSSGGNCINNYQVISVTAVKPHNVCGCKKPTVRDPVKNKCVKLAQAPPSPPVVVPDTFLRRRYEKCPDECPGRTTYCTRRPVCRKCGQCSPCGSFGNQPCPKVLIGSGQVCASNYVLLASSDPGAPSLCGCKPGTIKVDNVCVRSRMSPPPPLPPIYGTPTIPARSMIEKPVGALGMSAVRNVEMLLPLSIASADPVTVDAAAPIKTLRFEECRSGCGSRTAYCTHAESCDSCDSCTLCGVPGGQPCPLEAFTSGARCLNNLEIVAPTQDIPRYTCGCRLPNVLDADTNACVIHA